MGATNPGTSVVTKIVFPAVDMAESIRFYEQLGFAVESYDSGYAWVKNGDAEVVHLAAVAELVTSENHAAGYFHVQDVDAWHQSWAGAGVSVGEVIDRPWGMREFELVDPSGNLIRVGQNL